MTRLQVITNVREAITVAMCPVERSVCPVCDPKVDAILAARPQATGRRPWALAGPPAPAAGRTSGRPCSCAGWRATWVRTNPSNPTAAS